MEDPQHQESEGERVSAKKEKRGRPPRPPTAKQHVQVMLRFTARDAKELERQAENMRLPMAAYARALVLRGLRELKEAGKLAF